MAADRHPPPVRPPDRTPAAARPSRRQVLRAACGGLALPVLAACASWWDGPSLSLDTVKLIAETGINNDSPVAVDLVILYDATLIPQLLALPARDWFARRQQFQRDYPEDLQVVSWEIVPGQTLEAQEVGRRSGARAGFLFANYFTPGDHRLRLAQQSAVQLRLLTAGFTIEPERTG